MVSFSLLLFSLSAAAGLRIKHSTQASVTSRNFPCLITMSSDSSRYARTFTIFLSVVKGAEQRSRERQRRAKVVNGDCARVKDTIAASNKSTRASCKGGWRVVNATARIESHRCDCERTKASTDRVRTSEQMRQRCASAVGASSMP
ncbi:hypothetical protein B0H13DRAFT_916579 [Mycena leptocephala]|nr:hypothetical protein B0H13DRAFT_916579 [Mycena leptocephala]